MAMETDERKAVQFYLMICLIALGLIVIPLLARGLEEWSLVPSLVGCVVVLTRLRTGPMLFLVALAWIVISAMAGVTPPALILYILTALPAILGRYRVRIFETDWGEGMYSVEPILDILLTIGVLIYLASHFRLLSITRSIFPVDRRVKNRQSKLTDRQKRRPGEPSAEHARSPSRVQQHEGMALFFTALIFTSLAELVWVWLNDRSAAMDLYDITDYPARFWMSNGVWRLITILWTAALFSVLVFSLINYLGTKKISKVEAEVMIQDDLWQQTRREQSRIQRWLAWGNKRPIQS